VALRNAASDLSRHPVRYREEWSGTQSSSDKSNKRRARTATSKESTSVKKQ